jgi:hypothetical protein
MDFIFLLEEVPERVPWVENRRACVRASVSPRLSTLSEFIPSFALQCLEREQYYCNIAELQVGALFVTK